MDDILSGKKILLGITGCIAAYKAAYLIRELKKREAEVKVVMTPSAAQFIAPLTISTLSQNEVIINMFPADQSAGTSLSTWHIDYALWADLMLIAPATLNTTAKIAHGFADNALTSLVLALRSPLIIVPAADVDMYTKKVTKENFDKLEKLGHYLVHAETGELASGLSGTGRFADNGKIIDAVEMILSGYKKDLTGRKILITAGPTYEDIDPVRFIGNRSSGKMGYAAAKAAFLRGADVTLISGPSSESIYPEIKLVKVRSAEEMHFAVESELKNNDTLIMSAAVADYKPGTKSDKKISKEEKLTSVELTETTDILKSINSKEKTVIGFALETHNELKSAEKKLAGKNLHMIILNSLSDFGAGFEHSTNKISVLHKDGRWEAFPLMSKYRSAHMILSEMLKIK